MKMLLHVNDEVFMAIDLPPLIHFAMSTIRS